MNTTIQKRFTHIAATFAALASLALLASSALAAQSHALPLWRVTDAQGHTLYLAGSMHMLKQGDYPLPHAFEKAFKQSERLIEELDLNAINPQKVRKIVKKLAVLPDGKTLEDAMDDSWGKAQALAGKADIKLAPYKHFKPWYAALRIVSLKFLKAGYNPMLGLDFHFANLAKKQDMPVAGLETLREQMNFFNDLALSTQRHYLLQLLDKLPDTKHDLKKLHAAWKTGDLEQLEEMAQKDFADYPDLRKTLINDRNRNWLPEIKRCLSENRKCFVVVGAEHMAGKAGLLSLLEKAGNHVEQLHGNWPAPASTGTNAAASAPEPATTQ